MSNYSKEEIAAFNEKDLRISKLAITKSLIEKSEDIYDVQKITDLVEKYIDYVYTERRDATKRGQAEPTSSADAGCVASNTEDTNWEQIAEGLNLAIPTSQNIKILNRVVDEYKKAHKASANPTDILTHIIDTFGKYPTNTESVEKVLKSLNKEN